MSRRKTEEELSAEARKPSGAAVRLYSFQRGRMQTMAKYVIRDIAVPTYCCQLREE
ncbi:MAG: hypothetical protein ISS52_07495 [Dehalococcoidia bacterium]|nr:hypothetical protein [Dehalococcoidia bacterium]